MYAHVHRPMSAVLVAAVLMTTAVIRAGAQASRFDAQPDPVATTQAAASEPQPPHDMQHMHMDDDQTMAMPSPRDGSGTSWLPDESPMYAVHGQAGHWTLMAHANAFLQYLRESGARGSGQVGSINWLMGMADRAVGAGHLGLRGMVSLEPWTIRGCGYPDLLASGEVCQGDAIHDRQHPHDLFMELAATYDRPLTGDLRLQLYGGPAGEPALGPTAFSHRISAMPAPLAPITHHWFDSTHIAFGVVTAGVYRQRWKAEASLFNGREPDETRTNVDFGALDSWSGRAWFLPTPRWALQVSAGRLTEAEAGHDGGPRIDVDRLTASATYHRVVRPGSIWASTIGWGRNQERGSGATNAFLAETNVTIGDRDTWFGRVELSEKSGHDLAIESPATFGVAKLQGGYTRYFPARHGFAPGVGAVWSAGIVPEALKPFYGSRVNLGLGVFLTIRPAERGMQ
jgi:hypothetical protein